MFVSLVDKNFGSISYDFEFCVFIIYLLLKHIGRVERKG